MIPKKYPRKTLFQHSVPPSKKPENVLTSLRTSILSKMQPLIENFANVLWRKVSKELCNLKGWSWSNLKRRRLIYHVIRFCQRLKYLNSRSFDVLCASCSLPIIQKCNTYKIYWQIELTASLATKKPFFQVSILEVVAFWRRYVWLLLTDLCCVTWFEEILKFRNICVFLVIKNIYLIKAFLNHILNLYLINSMNFNVEFLLWFYLFR